MMKLLVLAFSSVFSLRRVRNNNHNNTTTTHRNEETLFLHAKSSRYASFWVLRKPARATEKKGPYRKLCCISWENQSFIGLCCISCWSPIGLHCCIWWTSSLLSLCLLTLKPTRVKSEQARKDAWNKLLAGSDLKLAKQAAMTGQLKRYPIRSLCWKAFLGCVSGDVSTWGKQVSQADRSLFEKEDDEENAWERWIHWFVDSNVTVGFDKNAIRWAHSDVHGGSSSSGDRSFVRQPTLTRWKRKSNNIRTTNNTTQHNTTQSNIRQTNNNTYEITWDRMGWKMKKPEQRQQQ